jgi:hypothetical protein
MREVRLSAALFCALATLALLAPAFARADAPPPRAFVLRVGAGGALLAGPDRLAGVGSLAGLIPIGDHVGIDLIGTLGIDPESGVGRAWVGLAAGVRVDLPLDAFRPNLALRIAHIHDAPLDAWGNHFGQTLAGDPTYGLGHLTALGGAVGLSWEVPGADRRCVLGVEVEGLGLVHGHVHHGRSPDAWLSATLSAGWQFL